MQMFFPFQARASNQNPPVGTVNIAVTAAQQNLALPTQNSISEGSVRIANVGTQVVFFCYGNQAGLTVTNGIPVLANSAETFFLPPSVASISVIAPATGSTVYATVGDGI